MRLPIARSVERITAEHSDISVFRGLNNLPRRVAGEMAAMENVSSRYPGCLYPRTSRTVLSTLTTPNALFVSNTGVICTVDGTNFKYGGTTKGTVTSSAKSMCDFYDGTLKQSVILIFPDKKYYNVTTNTFGTLPNYVAYPPVSNGVPDLDRVYSHSNRVWGYKGRTLYCSKHSNHLIWNQFSHDIDGISIPADDDSCAFTISESAGNITGLCPMESHMCFMTNHSTYEVFGDRPLNYIPVLVSSSRGSIDARSLVPLEGRVFMAAADGIAQYSGSHPKPIAYQLDVLPTQAVAGTDGRRYYVSLYNGSTWTLYSYDTSLASSGASPWYQEDDLHVIDFAYYNGILYALASTGEVYQFNYGSEVISWSAETDTFNYGYLGNANVPQIKVEAELEEGASLEVQLKVGHGEYFTIAVYSFEEPQGLRYYSTNISPQRGERFQIRFVGYGNTMVKSLVRDIIPGSDVK